MDGKPTISTCVPSDDVRKQIAAFAKQYMREGLVDGVDRRSWTITVPAIDGTLTTMTLEEAAGGPDEIRDLLS